MSLTSPVGSKRVRSPSLELEEFPSDEMEVLPDNFFFKEAKEGPIYGPYLSLKPQKKKKMPYKRSAFIESANKKAIAKVVVAPQKKSMSLAQVKAVLDNERKLKRDRANARQVSNARKLKRLITEQYPRGTDYSKTLYGENWGKANPLQQQYRKALRFKGDGDYKEWLGYGARGLGALAGGAYGYMRSGMSGAGAGLEEGWKQGAKFSKDFAGWGDYGPMSANQIIDGGSGSQQQISVNQGDLSGDLYVQRTEFVGNVTATAAGAGISPFQVVTYPLNPGLPETFPFLSQIAGNFSLYEPMGLIFQFKPTSGEFGSSTSNSLGKVVMATQYDPDAAPFTSAVEMENYDYANSSKPSVGMVHGVECARNDRSDNMLYVRVGQSNKSQVFTDIGDFQIATEGISFSSAGTAILGELWVTYKFRLSRANVSAAMNGAMIQQAIITGQCIASNPANLIAYRTTNSLAMQLEQLSATEVRLSFPTNISSGQYQVVACYYGGNWTTARVNGIQSMVNCQIYVPGILGRTGSNQNPDSVNVLGSPTNAAATTTNNSIMIQFQVAVTAPGALRATVNWNIGGPIPTGSYYVYVTKVASL